MIIEISSSGYIVKGYDKDNPVFKYYPVRRKNSDVVINVGGVSENFLTWTEDKTYEVGQIVELSDNYYRVKISHTSSDNFNQDNFSRLIAKKSKTQVVNIKNQSELKNFFKKNLIANEIVICMGAGSISNWIREIGREM